jgi:hypothetical protein
MELRIILSLYTESTLADDEKCKRRRLAERGSFVVELCDCEAVHLTVGFLTLRLDPRAYRELAGALEEALRAISVPEQQTIH